MRKVTINLTVARAIEKVEWLLSQPALHEADVIQYREGLREFLIELQKQDPNEKIWKNIYADKIYRAINYSGVLNYHIKVYKREYKTSRKIRKNTRESR